ncbi:hypothetical protein GCM10012319_01650 [Comamonas sp. KCTC 72670]|nr:hypothetical protein GCM10012319_01650 [Comamonas sp. KCTC 72670]
MPRRVELPERNHGQHIPNALDAVGVDSQGLGVRRWLGHEMSRQAEQEAACVEAAANPVGVIDFVYAGKMSAHQWVGADPFETMREIGERMEPSRVGIRGQSCVSR